MIKNHVFLTKKITKTWLRRTVFLNLLKSSKTLWNLLKSCFSKGPGFQIFLEQAFFKGWTGFRKTWLLRTVSLNFLLPESSFAQANFKNHAPSFKTPPPLIIGPPRANFPPAPERARQKTFSTVKMRWLQVGKNFLFSFFKKGNADLLFFPIFQKKTMIFRHNFTRNSRNTRISQKLQTRTEIFEKSRLYRQFF